MDFEQIEHYVSDTQIPNLFIIEYMDRLSKTEIQLYLFACFCTRNGIVFSEQNFIDYVCCTIEEYQVAKINLSKYELISINKDTFIVNNIKLFHLQDYTDYLGGKAQKREVPQIDEDCSSLLTAINTDFFSGVMSPGWLHTIDSYLNTYGFSKEVVYCLFQDVSRRGKLSSNKNYINHVAEDWFRHGVKNFSDVEKHLKTVDEIGALTRKIGNKLNRTMNAYDQEYVNKWKFVYGYDLPIIELALKQGVNKASQVGIKYYDAILQNWYDNKLKTVEDVQAYLDSKKYNKRKYVKQNGKNKPRDTEDIDFMKSVEAVLYENEVRERER